MRDAALHKGHRKRLRQKYQQVGLDKFKPHEILELLLHYAIPQIDTNELAHRLLKRFGSLANVLDADMDALMQVDGIGETAACLICFQRDMCRQYYNSKRKIVGQILLTKEDIKDRVNQLFYGVTVEQMHMICMDMDNRVISSEMICEGSIDTVPVYTRKIIACALRLNAKQVILAHNHPSGVLMPSQADRDATDMIAQALSYINVKLYDHIIVAGHHFSSMRTDFKWGAK